MSNPFFKNTGPYNLNFLLENLSIKRNEFDEQVVDIKDLSSSHYKDITFFHSKKYADQAKTTKASYCITTEKLKSYLPEKCVSIISDKVLLDTAIITKIFYPDSVTDDFDNTVEDINTTNFKKKVKFGKNVLIGQNVKIGFNCLIGHNTIIEKNVSIGDNCSIGSNVIIRNSLIKNNVHILDGCVVGKKPKPFLPITHPSKIFTSSLTIVFLIITLEPIEQLAPITTFFSIIVL